MQNGVPETEFSETFVNGMRDRMAVSYFKYGPVANGFPHKVDAIGTLMTCLRQYEEDGNTEHLMDAGNYCMIEFMHPRHPNAHFEGTDDGKSVGRVALRTGRVDHRDNSDVGYGANASAVRAYR